MQSKKKILAVLACGTALATGFVLNNNHVLPTVVKVKASTTSVAARSYGVDVSSYQSSDVSSLAKAGGQFAIVKVSEGTSYQNPNGASQINSAIANNMLPMAYHFATFSSNSSAAAAEGKYAVSVAKSMGLPSGAYLACDYETGDGNVVTGSASANATAILAFMDQVEAAGYQPLLYSSASILNNNISTSSVLAKYPNSLWVASYATMGRIDTADFNYFPSMDGVIIWQFTDNWRGLSVDGNISLLPLTMNSSSTATSSASSQAATTNINQQASASVSRSTSTTRTVKTTKTVMHRAAVYDSTGKRSGSYVYPTYSKVTVLGGIVRINGRNFYKIGSNQHLVASNIDGTRKTLSHNAYIYTSKGTRVYVPTLKKGTSLTVYGAKVKLNGKYYYRINVARYIKAGNIG